MSSLGPALPTVPLPLDEAFRIAGEYEAAGRFDDAERLLRLILGAAPALPGPLHLMGIVAYRRGRIADALDLMERAIRNGLDTPLSFRNICEVYRALGRYDDALAAGRRAVDLNPGDPVALVNLAIVHGDRREFDSAISCAETALRIEPDLA